MNKEEFLTKLRQALNGAGIPANIVQENISYYNDYITEEVRKGRQEEEVISEIGDPRLIAKTIEETTETVENVQSEEYYNDRSSEETVNQQFKVHDLNKWYWKVLLILIPFLFLCLVFTIIGGIFSLLAPVLTPILIILFVIYLWQSFMR